MLSADIMGTGNVLMMIMSIIQVMCIQACHYNSPTTYAFHSILRLLLMYLRLKVCLQFKEAEVCHGGTCSSPLNEALTK